MTIPRDIKSLSAVTSLAVLAGGFILLGLLALTSRGHQDVSGDTLLESNCCIVGSIISIVAGAIFLVAGWIYWNRSPALAGTWTNQEQGRAEKNRDIFQRPFTSKALRPEVSILYRRNPLSKNALVPAKPNGNRTVSEIF
jgi:hypothetical protein